MEKLDYRCRGQQCRAAKECRRFLTGAAAKQSSVPMAAFDVRLDPGGVCGSLLQRRDVEGGK